MPRWRSTQNGVVSYLLARQRLIDAVMDGTRSKTDVCDAQPELRRVAHNYGTAHSGACPICEGDDVVLVTFAFGRHLPAAGRCVTDDDELARLRQRQEPTMCYQVEVCRRCWWNHLRESYALTPDSYPAPSL